MPLQPIQDAQHASDLDELCFQSVEGRSDLLQVGINENRRGVIWPSVHEEPLDDRRAIGGRNSETDRYGWHLFTPLPAATYRLISYITKQFHRIHHKHSDQALSLISYDLYEKRRSSALAEQRAISG